MTLHTSDVKYIPPANKRKVKLGLRSWDLHHRVSLSAGCLLLVSQWSWVIVADWTIRVLLSEVSYLQIAVAQLEQGNPILILFWDICFFHLRSISGIIRDCFNAPRLVYFFDLGRVRFLWPLGKERYCVLFEPSWMCGLLKKTVWVLDCWLTHRLLAFTGQKKIFLWTEPVLNTLTRY